MGCKHEQVSIHHFTQTVMQDQTWECKPSIQYQASTGQY